MNQLLLFNASVYDPSQKLPPVNALYIENDKIARLCCGQPRVNGHVRKIDLQGKCIMPGFIDSHTHLVSRGLELQYIDMDRCTSLDECLTMLREHRNSYDVVFASNWDESQWKSFKPTMLTRGILDRISRSKPVIMRRVCGHCAVVNTVALRKIPARWRIVDRKTGWLYEDAALFLNTIFKPDAAMETKAVKLACAEAVRRGITSIHEIGNLNRFSLLQHARNIGVLKIRVAFYVLVQEIEKIITARIRKGFGDPFLRFSGIKVFADGSIGAQTAALTRSYQGTRCRGKILVSKNRLKRIIRLAEQNDLQLMIHTIGDRTTAHVVSALDGIIRGKNELRHRLEHLECANRKEIARIARLNLIASMQPNFTRRWQQPGGMYEEYFGSGYTRLNLFRTIHAAGIKLVFGSDCMPMDPLYGIQGACEHPGLDGRISRSIAFKAYTSAGAFATYEERQKGQLKEGMNADLVILNHDPRSVKKIDSLQVMGTFVAGKQVFKRRS